MCDEHAEVSAGAGEFLGKQVVSGVAEQGEIPGEVHLAEIGEVVAITLRAEEILGAAAKAGKKGFPQTGSSRTGDVHCWPRGRPPAPKWVSFWSWSIISPTGCVAGKKEANIEQQMSAECAPGMMALRTAMAPPTGMPAVSCEEGQASDIRAPASITGMRSSSRMRLRQTSRLANSSGDSA